MTKIIQNKPFNYDFISCKEINEINHKYQVFLKKDKLSISDISSQSNDEIDLAFLNIFISDILLSLKSNKS